MLIEDLRQIDDVYDHVYLSPHLDDAALSCGGAIAQHAAGDSRVLVVTFCTGAPAPEGPFTAFADNLHRLWGLTGASVVAARLLEDDLALERLSADTYRAGMLDAVYRVPEAYDSGERLFGAPVPGDPFAAAARGLVAELRRRLPRAAFYAPLGVGQHVDHQLVYTAARAAAGEALAFYEDFPYVARGPALERRLAGIGQRFVDSTIAIDATLATKVAAVEAYASQLGTLFDRPDGTAEAIGAYAKSVAPEGATYGERLWIPDPRDPASDDRDAS
jgi:LmbE family N-acetylglucosaminyl deacetylase